MTDLVNVSEIERIVGVRRHVSDHYGRAVSAEQTVYILHSEACRDSGIDLRNCVYSVALDLGIEHVLPWTGWRRVQDRPTRLSLLRGFLMPDFDDYRKECRAQAQPRRSPFPADGGVFHGI